MHLGGVRNIIQHYYESTLLYGKLFINNRLLPKANPITILASLGAMHQNVAQGFAE